MEGTNVSHQQVDLRVVDATEHKDNHQDKPPMKTTAPGEAAGGGKALRTSLNCHFRSCPALEPVTRALIQQGIRPVR